MRTLRDYDPWLDGVRAGGGARCGQIGVLSARRVADRRRVVPARPPGRDIVDRQIEALCARSKTGLTTPGIPWSRRLALDKPDS